MKTSWKHTLLVVGAQLGSLLTLLLLIALPVNRYDWFAEMDPGTIVPLDPTTDDRRLVANLLLLLIVVLQCLMYRCSRGPGGRMLALVIIVWSLAIWLLRWWP